MSGRVDEEARSGLLDRPDDPQQPPPALRYLFGSPKKAAWEDEEDGEEETRDRLYHEDESFEMQHALLSPRPSTSTSHNKRWQSCPTELSAEGEGAPESAERVVPYYYQSTIQAGRYHPGEESMKKVFGRGHFLPPNLFKNNAKEKVRNLFDAGRSGDQSVRKSESVQSNEQRQAVEKKKTRKNRVQKLLNGVVADWLFLALLGASMAVCSLAMDIGIEKLGNLHIKWLNATRPNGKDVWQTLLSYVLWCTYSVVLVSGSAFFCHFVSPQAVGSGIPEMKTVLRGVYLKEYLSFRTLISKMVGLTLSLGSGLPIGKEGPFVHVASVVANMLWRLVNSFDSVYINESRHTEMLAAGCAVGVACVFSAPVGGVLFSIEVTSVYFAVRNYWRGFFAAACSATVFRLLRVVLQLDLTVVAFYQTWFPKEAFFPEELPLFALIGLVCGFASAAFIWLHRRMVLFLRFNRFMKMIFQEHWYLYPILVSLVIASITFPDGFGMFLGGERKFSLSARDFFKNCTWTAPVNSSQYCTDSKMLDYWMGKDRNLNVFLVLSLFTVTFFFLAALASTIPIPSGTFGPSFTLGAAFGRIVGEIVAAYYPNGVREEELVQVYPGVYAVVGAAAFCGGVTHTVSVAVIVFELTGQLVYLLPVMIAVLIANAVCSYLQPSIYDSIIKIKHLPFLPDIPHSATNFHGIRVEQIMTSAVRFLTPQSTYGELQTILFENTQLKSLPVVDGANGILLGSCSRSKLLQSLERHVGQAARQAAARRRITEGFDEVARRCRSHTYEGTNTLLPSSTLSPEPKSSEDERALPSKLNFYYRGRPPTPPPPSSSETPKEEVEEGEDEREKEEKNEATRKLSRFTVTNVPAGEKRKSDASSERVPSPNARDRSSSDGDESSGSSPKSRKRRTNAFTHTMTGLARTLTHLSTGRHLPRSVAEIDLYGDDRKQWEAEQLAKCIDWREVSIDTAPFQLIGSTSMLKVHSLFSLLGLNRAYVTKCGRLVGVVALRDIRLAIEKIQTGQLVAKGPPMQIDPPDDPEAQRLGRSNSFTKQQLEDGRNDRLNPNPMVISRTQTFASLKDAKSSSILLDSGILNGEAETIEEEDERTRSPFPNPPRLPTNSLAEPNSNQPTVESTSATIPMEAVDAPQINVIPPREDANSSDSEGGISFSSVSTTLESRRKEDV